MRETDFIAKNEKKWKRYEQALHAGEQSPEILTELYVHTTDDLSYSRTFYPNRSVRVYLNNLAQRTFLQIYRGRRGETRQFFSFWTDELPRVVYRRRSPLLTSLLIFVLAMVIGIVSFRIDDSFAQVILGEGYVDMTRENIAAGDPMRVYKDAAAFDMALAITANNIYVAFLTFISGALFAVGSIVQLLRNGVMLGVFQYYFYDAGLLSESFLAIWIHGALEISAIVIAGGAGITMGSGLLFPGTLSRFNAFKRTARDGLKIMLGTVPLFIIAGFLEGFVTRHTELPAVLRGLFILLCFTFIIWYYYFYPRQVIRVPPVEEISVRQPSQSGEGKLERQRLRRAGENLETTFSVFRKSLGEITTAALVVGIIFTTLSMYFYGGAVGDRYWFDDQFLLGDLNNFYEIFASFGRGRGLGYLLLVATFFYALFRVAYRAVWQASDLEVLPAGWRSELYLFLIATGVALLLSWGSVTTLIATLFVLPVLFVAAYAGYTGMDGFGKSTGTALRYYGAIISNYLVLLLMAIPTMWLIDTVIISLFFSFLDWIIYVDGYQVPTANAILQSILYLFLFFILLSVATVSLVLRAYHIHEATHADKLLEDIQQIGARRRIRGMELE